MAIWRVAEVPFYRLADFIFDHTEHNFGNEYILRFLKTLPFNDLNVVFQVKFCYQTLGQMQRNSWVTYSKMDEDLWPVCNSAISRSPSKMLWMIVSVFIMRPMMGHYTVLLHVLQGVNLPFDVTFQWNSKDKAHSGREIWILLDVSWTLWPKPVSEMQSWLDER